MSYGYSDDGLIPEPEFSYAVWTANTKVELFNVPWNSDYRDIVRFADKPALDNYLRTKTGPSITLEDMTYARPEQPIDVDIPFNTAYLYNYIRVHNPAQPVGGDRSRNFYYFITNVEHRAPNTTRLHVQLDVWQTFSHDITFGNCYIERGHIGIANSRNFEEYGRNYLTVPEGLDVGGEYRIINILSRKIASARAEEGIIPDYSILVTSTTDLTADPGSTTTQPILTSATGSDAENLPNGADSYLFQNVNDFKAFLSARKNAPWMLQGIVSITAVPNEYPILSEGVITPDGIGLLKLRPGTLRAKQTAMASNWRDAAIFDLPARYRHLKKFLTYPYMVMELTSYTGTPLILKPESWQSASATVMELPHYASSGARIMFAPMHYNAETTATVSDGSGLVRDSGEFLDLATGIFNFPQFSVVNNGTMQYLAANQSGIAYQQQSADWSQQRALTGNNLAYDQASANMSTSEEMNRLGVNASAASTNLQNDLASAHAGLSILGAAGGMGTGAIGAGLGVANMAGKLADMTVGTLGRNQALGISTGLANAQTAAQVGNAGFMRDTNKGYADYAARGDYQNQIAGIQAKLQDAKMIQPTTAGQVGGDAFLLSRYQWGYDVKIKLLDPAAMAAVGEYWLRYGYQVNRFGQMPAGIHCMTKFTYWKLRETYITSSWCPETFKQAIRGIFEKGVTVWSNPADIGNTDLALNVPLDGITL